MRFINGILAVLLVTAFTQTAFAGPWKILFQDEKLPSQAVLEHATWATPIVATTNYINTSSSGPTSAAALTVSTFAHQPDYPRNITVTSSGTTASVQKACVVVVNGTNIYGQSIYENFTFSDSSPAAVVGNKAFKTVSSIVYPANCEGGDFSLNWIVGVGSKLGLPRCMNQAGDYDFSVFNGAYETSRGTIAANATAIESNTFIPNGTMNGSSQVDLYYVQNFRCYP